MSDMVKMALDHLRANINDRVWRLEHFYHIIDEHGRKVQFKLRPAQRDFVLALWYFNIVLKARQEGFTTLICLMGLDMCLFLPNTTCVIIAETKDKAKEILNDKIKYPYDHLPYELKEARKLVSSDAEGVAFSNGSKIQVMVSARSLTCQFLLVSEYGKVSATDPLKSKEIKTGCLPAVHEGGFVFIESTAMGNEGNFFDLVQMAKPTLLSKKKLAKREFKLHFYPWYNHKDYRIKEEVVIPARLLDYFDRLYDEHGITLDEEQQRWYASNEKVLGEEMWSEYPSTVDEAFQVAKDGAYYARQFNVIYKENRITKVPYEPALGVYTSWDLGISDNTAIWFWQFLGKEIRLIDYHEGDGEGLSHYVTVVKSKPYRYLGHFAPHDIEQREYSTGISRREYAYTLGIEMERVPTDVDLLGGIEAVRQILPYCYFDASATEAGVKCLTGYCKDWDEKRGAYKPKPRHDWASHGADAFRTMAVAIKFGMIPYGTTRRTGKITHKGGLVDGRF